MHAMSPQTRLAGFNELYREHFRLTWSVVGQLGIEAAHREDLVQEVWLTVHRRLHTLRPDASVKAWLCSIARKVVSRHHRANARLSRRMSAYAAQPQEAGSDPSRQYDAATTLDAALASLNDDQRRVLVLAELHGLTAPEISNGLRVPVNTVYSRLRLARRRLDRFAAAALNDSLAHTEQPPEGASRRTLGLVMAAIGDAAAAPVVATTGGVLASLKGAAVGMALGGAVLATVVVGASTAREANAETSAPLPSPEAAETVVVLEAPAAAAAPTLVEPEPERVVMPTPVAPATKISAPKRPTAAASVPASSDAAERPSATLDAEAELLRRAQAALRGGNALVALNLLKSHERQFARGRLVDARRGAMVRVLCKLGRTREARAEATKLKREVPGSAVAAAVSDACE